VTLGKSFLLAGLTLTKLQGHADRRHKLVSPVTIKKELNTFRAVWNWGLRHGKTDMPFPGKGIVYPKTTEKPPFMSRDEIERRIKARKEKDTCSATESRS
jgi:hypothetical protein